MLLKSVSTVGKSSGGLFVGEGSSGLVLMR